MKLDLDFLRELLIKIEDWESYEKIMTNKDLVDSDTPIAKVNYYLDLFIAEKLIEAKKTVYIDGTKNYEIERISFLGSNFLNPIKNKNFWQKHKEAIINTGISSLPHIIEFVMTGKIFG